MRPNSHHLGAIVAKAGTQGCHTPRLTVIPAKAGTQGGHTPRLTVIPAKAGTQGCHTPRLTVSPAKAGTQGCHTPRLTVIPAKTGIQETSMQDGQPAVYILASKRNGTLYTGVTSDLPRRAFEHKNGLVEGFTRKYHVNMLVYYEYHATISEAIAREKQIKKWNRAWKLRLIERDNPQWQDLSEDPM